MTLTVFLSIANERKTNHSDLNGKEISTVSAIENDAYFIPGYGKSFIGFKEALGFKESRGKYQVINTLGYMGKYQFGKSTLNTLRVYDSVHFLKNPKLQEKVFAISIAQNKYLLDKEINEFVGKEIKGIVITESGILAAAHLAGVGNVKKFLYSNGKRRVGDAYGTKIENYFLKFSHYDLSSIKPEKNPKI